MWISPVKQERGRLDSWGLLGTGNQKTNKQNGKAVRTNIISKQQMSTCCRYIRSQVKPEFPLSPMKNKILGLGNKGNSESN